MTITKIGVGIISFLFLIIYSLPSFSELDLDRKQGRIKKEKEILIISCIISFILLLSILIICAI